MSDNSVKRYNVENEYMYLCESVVGEYVLHDDHIKAIASLQSEVEALRKIKMFLEMNVARPQPTCGYESGWWRACERALDSGKIKGGE